MNESSPFSYQSQNHVPALPGVPETEEMEFYNYNSVQQADVGPYDVANTNFDFYTQPEKVIHTFTCSSGEVGNDPNTSGADEDSMSNEEYQLKDSDDDIILPGSRKPATTIPTRGQSQPAKHLLSGNVTDEEDDHSDLPVY